MPSWRSANWRALSRSDEHIKYLHAIRNTAETSGSGATTGADEAVKSEVIISPSLRPVFHSLTRSVIQSFISHRRRDSTVELSRVGGVNASVGSCDPVYNFLCC